MNVGKKMSGPIATTALLAMAALGCEGEDGAVASDGAATTRGAEANKQLVLRAYEKVLNGHDMTELEALFAENLIQHNPQVPDGRAALAEFLSYQATLESPLHGEVKRVVAEGDLVMIHAHLTTSEAERNNEYAGMAVVDVFRVANGKIVEHWDVIQAVSATSANKNSMFDGGGLYTGE